MSQAQNNILDSIRAHHRSKQITLKMLIVILNQRKIGIREARLYLQYAKDLNINQWRETKEQQLNKIAIEAFDWIVQQRKNNEARQKIHQSNVQKYQSKLIKVQQILKQGIAQLDRQKVLLLIDQKIANKTKNKKSISDQQNKLLIETSGIAKDISQYQEEIKQNQQEEKSSQNILIQQILKQTNLVQKRNQQQKNQTIDLMEQYKRKLNLVIKNLKLIFGYYCREHHKVISTFEKFQSNAQLMDLHMFFIYLKDYRYQQKQKRQKYRVQNMTKLFKAIATFGLHLNQDQFWAIHKKWFEIEDLNFTTQKVQKAKDKQSLQYEEKLHRQMKVLKQLSDIIQNQNTQHIQRIYRQKTEANSLAKAKSSTLNAIQSRVYKTKSSGKLQKNTVFSSKKSLTPNNQRKNFIQQIRQQVKNQELKHKIKQKSKSLNGMSPGKNIDLNLPKILKLSSQEITSQGIYQSLKHFATYDYLAQQKKIRNIIGLSKGEDEKPLQAYFNRQQTNRKEKIAEKLLQRQHNRKHKMHSPACYCKRYNPEEIQPYMRFS